MRECKKCEHHRVIDDHGIVYGECLLQKCPLEIIAAERERCMQKAEGKRKVENCDPARTYNLAVDDIIAAIRRGE